jgi:hypothetical protein
LFVEITGVDGPASENDCAIAEGIEKCLVEAQCAGTLCKSDIRFPQTFPNRRAFVCLRKQRGWGEQWEESQECNFGRFHGYTILLSFWYCSSLAPKYVPFSSSGIAHNVQDDLAEDRQ